MIAWLRQRPRCFLIRNLLSVNLPVTGLVAVPVALAINLNAGGTASPATLPEETVAADSGCRLVNVSDEDHAPRQRACGNCRTITTRGVGPSQLPRS